MSVMSSLRRQISTVTRKPTRVRLTDAARKARQFQGVPEWLKQKEKKRARMLSKARANLGPFINFFGLPCVCHLGSVCTEACEKGKHHDGCGQADS